MLNAFASVGARAFNLTLIDIEGNKVHYRPNRPLEELHRIMPRVLQDAERHRHNVIIRPRSPTATLIQLDDLDREQTKHLAPHAFLCFQTSPAKYQVWVAVEKDAPKDFKLRLKRGAKADTTATESTRIAGSKNFKPAYVPAFPTVEIVRSSPGNITTAAVLEKAGFVASPEPPQPPASVPPAKTSPPGQRMTGPPHWPDYRDTLRKPKIKDGKIDRSVCDFLWCKWAIERGHGIDETAAKLPEVSERAMQSVQRGDTNYPRLTAWKAARAVERDRNQPRP
jgi:hypothetical protein